jgi:O-antigen ligase
VNSPRHPQPPGPTELPARLSLLALIVVAAVLPPEARGESMAGCAVLIAITALLRWGSPAGSAGRLAWLTAGLLLAILAGVSALAPGAAVEPIAVGTLAAAAGIAAAGLRTDADTRRQGAVALAVSATVVSAHAIYQKTWGFARMLESLAADPDLPDRAAVLSKLAGGRAFAGFITPAGLGGFLALALPVTVALALESRGARRVAWVIPAALQTAAFLAAASATATVALLGATALAALAWNRGRRVMLIGMAVMGLLLVGVVAQRDGALLDPLAGRGPLTERAGNFRSAWAMAADHPFVGVGPGGYSELYPRYRRTGDNETRHVHNLTLEAAADLGWPAAAALTLLVFFLFVRPLWAARDREPAWRKGLAIGLATFPLHNLGDFTFYMPSVLWIAAVLLGLSNRRGSSAAAVPVRGTERALVGASLAGVVLAAAAAALTGLSSDARLTARYASFAGDPEAALSHAERAVSWAPWDPDAALLYARASQAAGEDARVALARADSAVALSPVRPVARELRARLRLATGDLEGAFCDLARASELYPIETAYAEARDAARGELGRVSEADSGGDLR